MVAKIQSSSEDTVKNRRGREQQAFSAHGGKTWEVNWINAQTQRRMSLTNRIELPGSRCRFCTSGGQAQDKEG